MRTSIEDLQMEAVDPIFDTIAFKNVIEDNLQWLLDQPSTTSREITANMTNVYAFDWIGLLTSLKIPSNLHHATIRMNGGKSYTDLPPMIRTIRVPSITLLQNFVMMLSSTGRVQ